MNSKTEYSRCRLPRLVIDNEEWKKSKKEEKKNLEKEIVSTENELDNDSNRGMENETDNNRMENKRKKGNNSNGQAKTKKRKLDPLVLGFHPAWMKELQNPQYAQLYWTGDQSQRCRQEIS